MDTGMSGQTPKDVDEKTVGFAPVPAAGSDPGGDWAQVAEALNTLGASIARATVAAVDNEENRRRLRELSDGLASLARRAGESIETAAASPEGEQVRAAVVHAAETIREAGDKAAETVREAGDKAQEQLRPHVLSAINSANEKFRQAAAQWEVKPTPVVEPPVEPAAETGLVKVPENTTTLVVTEASTEAPAAVTTVAPVGARTAEPTPAPVAAPATESVATPVPARVFESVPVSVEKLDAVRVAHERFVAERKAAEAAAAASKAAAGAPAEEPLLEESVIGPEPVAESTDSDDSPLW